jgi:cytochrome c peroxidase
MRSKFLGGYLRGMLVIFDVAPRKRGSWQPLVLMGCAAIVLFAARREAVAQFQSARVVSDAKYTSPYDAFMKINRFREDFQAGESAAEYWGFMESRLGNQAGRILIKRPAQGFSDDAFRGWLKFVRSYGDANGIGNCTACHTVPDFTDGKKHSIGTSSVPVPTPSLRDLAGRKSFFRDGSAATLEAAIARHVSAAQIAQQNKRADIEVEIGKIALTEVEVREVAAFLRSLQSVERSQFRNYLIDVVVQPVEIDFSD